jgi:hypothetical protein
MSVDILEVEDRILLACRTIRALPDRERKYFALHNCWPEMAALVEEAYGYTEVALPKFRPSPADVSDCLVALAWARGIPRRAWRLVWWRSFGVDTPRGFSGMSFRHMAIRVGRSDETVRRWYRDAILGIWAEANRLPIVDVGEKSSIQRVANVADFTNSPIRWASRVR